MLLCDSAKKYAWNCITGEWVLYGEDDRREFVIWTVEFGIPDRGHEVPLLRPAEDNPEVEVGYPEPAWDLHPDQKLVQDLNRLHRLSSRLSNNGIQMDLKKLDPTGNLIPKSWLIELRTGKGRKERPYLEAIYILSEIVYWYRPSKNGRKRYAGDVLQLSYNQMSERSHMTKMTVKAACDYLEEVGLIFRELRNIVSNGHHLSNVMYIYLDFDKVKDITYREKTSKATPLD